MDGPGNPDCTAYGANWNNIAAGAGAGQLPDEFKDAWNFSAAALIGGAAPPGLNFYARIDNGVPNSLFNPMSNFLTLLGIELNDIRLDKAGVLIPVRAAPPPLTGPIPRAFDKSDSKSLMAKRVSAAKKLTTLLYSDKITSNCFLFSTLANFKVSLVERIIFIDILI